MLTNLHLGLHVLFMVSLRLFMKDFFTVNVLKTEVCKVKIASPFLYDKFF